MATSAFRSTTRRNCQISGYSSSAEGGGIPATPLSKRDPSPSGRGFHRRSASVSDFSARYLSDCSSTSDLRSCNNKSSRTGRRSVCPSDSENDMDSLSTHRQYGKWGVELEDERPANSFTSKTGLVKLEHKGLRRTFSSQDLSQAIHKMRHHVPVLLTKTEGDDTEGIVEEKTIRAVYAQMKSLHTDPPVGDVGMTDFLDAMRAEVRRAVSDVRIELEESMQKNGKLSTSSAENRSESHGTDVIQAVADIRKEYTTKLEESEKRVRELWSQIAVEERRCLELSKIVKELLPTPPPAIVPTSMAHSSSSRRRPLRRKNSTERQLDTKNLHDEAYRYFEECVSIFSYDCQGDSNDYIQGKENSNRRRSMKEGYAKALSMGTNGKGESQPNASSVGSDGVVLPWLQWEAEAGAAGDKNLKQVERNAKGISSKNSPLHRLGSSSHPKPNNTSAELGKPSLTTLAGPVWSESGALEAKSDLFDSKQMSSTIRFTLDDNTIRKESTTFLDVDLLLFEKIKFRCRVEKGELLLCQGLFLM
ncbi:hypothetical protein GOP47_0000835 [Adiantum capillus-veneris]|uniref:Uncharacterized protein n=1 Tax=Adiantum capillus-veneris TaxID=13818 RepID=A0A9D4VFH2_ADICA|nr:hypothetical protein GOP47_0000835 [Adiantum capillus-veneris]